MGSTPIPSALATNLCFTDGGIEQRWLTSFENWGLKRHVGSNPTSSARYNPVSGWQVQTCTCRNDLLRSA